MNFDFEMVISLSEIFIFWIGILWIELELVKKLLEKVILLLCTKFFIFNPKNVPKLFSAGAHPRRYRRPEPAAHPRFPRCNGL